MIKKLCKFGSHDSLVWWHVFWEHAIFSVSSDTKRQSAVCNKCNTEDMDPVKEKTWDPQMSPSKTGSRVDCLLIKIELWVAAVPSSLFLHLSIIPQVITAISLARKSVSHLLLSCYDGWNLIFSRGMSKHLSHKLQQHKVYLKKRCFTHFMRSIRSI